jgi:Glycosyl hydrolase family 3 N terminal domain/Fibronectin type III-like domain
MPGPALPANLNVLLAGGINLAREPRNGRNFEYGGEDPLLAANVVAAQIRGIQSNHIISTIKHFALNDQETNRTTLSVRVDDRAARMSDLLAFELAIGESSPGAVMCAYNRVNGIYSCENRWLLEEVLKRGAGGYVAQVYVSPIGGAAAAGWEAPTRLCGFKKVSLQPGESADVSLGIEPRMLAVYDEAGRGWIIEEGDYDFSLSIDSRNAVTHRKVHISRQVLPKDILQN